jgi:hypothetical protein
VFNLLVSIAMALAGLVTHFITAPAQTRDEGPRIELPTNRLAQKYLDQLVPRGRDLRLATCYGPPGLMYVVILPQGSRQGEFVAYSMFTAVMQADQMVLNAKSGVWQLRSLKQALNPEQQDSAAFDNMTGEDAVAFEFGKIMQHQPKFTVMHDATIDSIPLKYTRLAAVQHVNPPQCP